MNIQRILKDLSTHFLSVSNNEIVYGPQGRIVLRNLEKEWFLHNSAKAPFKVFLLDNSSDITTTLLQEPLESNLFGIAQLELSKTVWNASITDPCLTLSQHRLAKLSVIGNKIELQSIFHKLQRERKIWWRKHSQWPSTFKLSEEKKGTDNNVVEILGKFTFGQITVERISYHRDVQENLAMVCNSKKGFRDIGMVENVMSLDWGCLALFCDTYISNTPTTTYLHPKLVPYKVAFLLKQSKEQTNRKEDGLQHFVLYLNNMLKAKGLDTIMTSVDVKNKYLVPLNILVSETSLENGIVYVRNRSTSIAEDVHVSQLADYVFKHIYH